MFTFIVYNRENVVALEKANTTTTDIFFVNQILLTRGSTCEIWSKILIQSFDNLTGLWSLRLMNFVPLVSYNTPWKQKIRFSNVPRCHRTANSKNIFASYLKITLIRSKLDELKEIIEENIDVLRTVQSKLD